MGSKNFITDNNIQLRKESIALGTISATTTKIVMEVTRDINIDNVDFTNGTGFSLSGTDNWSFSLVNKGLEGSGTTKIIDDSNVLNTTKLTGSTLTAYKYKELTITPANSYVAKGSILVFTMTKTGTPSDLAEGFLTIKYRGAL